MLSAFVLVLTLSTTYPPCNEEQLAYYEAKGWDAYECAADMANLPMEQDDYPEFEDNCDSEGGCE